MKALLGRAAGSHVDRGILAYPLNNNTDPKRLTYTELHNVAHHNSRIMAKLEGFSKGSIVLIHLNQHLDNIVWFWSVIYAGCIPAMSTPFAHNPEHRNKHILHLRQLLDDPVCLTTEKQLEEFPGACIMRLRTIESLGNIVLSERELDQPITNVDPTGLAMLMLTSGSTGNAKAVRLTHKQILASVTGKSATLTLDALGNHTFLNWVGLDHVGSLIEIHLHAMFIVVDQVHVQAQDIISEPTLFLELISRHFVARTFAPNFFLAKLRRVLERENSSYDFDLSCLRYIVSGGEANVMDTCTTISELLGRYKAPQKVIVPAFGMTETCAGSIYNLNCPEYDLKHGHEFASLGHCVPGIQMRVSVAGSNARAEPGEAGDLEVTGQIVFDGYHNDLTATAEAFTADGWFKTGDIANIDSNGKLNFAGRTKETITINGLKYLPHEMETAIEEANIPGVTPSYTLCFAHRPKNSQTEQTFVVYLPSYAPENIEARMDVLGMISKVVFLHTGARPHVLPLDTSVLQKSTLGKLSRTKIRASLGRGDYRVYEEVNDNIVKAYKTSAYVSPSDDVEQMLVEELEQVLDLPEGGIGLGSSILDFGMTSVDLIKFKRRIERRLQLETEIPMITIMTHTTLRSLREALRTLDTPGEYSPVVTLQSQGLKTPLWLIHPGVGEILVFLNLAKYLYDRPVHALRARGFNTGETYFDDISETVAVYSAAIRKQQPSGPYALAGYSYGSMLAFEISKRLEHDGSEVRFLGCFNLPPHIKFRMRQLDWTECLLHLSYFLDLITEQYSQDVSAELHTYSKKETLAHIVRVAAPARMAELSLSPEQLANWADLAFALQSMAKDYDPSGAVEALDIFYCEPLAVVAQSKAEWRANHLEKWADFCRTSPRFHDVDGSHYTMIGPDHVYSFQKQLRKALQARDL